MGPLVRILDVQQTRSHTMNRWSNPSFDCRLTAVLGFSQGVIALLCYSLAQMCRSSSAMERHKQTVIGDRSKIVSMLGCMIWKSVVTINEYWACRLTRQASTTPCCLRLIHSAVSHTYVGDKLPVYILSESAITSKILSRLFVQDAARLFGMCVACGLRACNMAAVMLWRHGRKEEWQHGERNMQHRYQRISARAVQAACNRVVVQIVPDGYAAQLSDRGVRSRQWPAAPPGWRPWLHVCKFAQAFLGL
jgi:hypothetical protein